MLSEKYFAGFFDADGSVQVMWRRARQEFGHAYALPFLSLEISQRADRSETLQLIESQFGGKFRVEFKKGVPYGKYVITGKKAMMLLYRIKQHLVIKRGYADFVLSILGREHNREEMKAELHRQRRIQNTIPNYPSRKWLAGYFDGDGCFVVDIGKNRTSASVLAEISCANYDDEGIRLLQKVFGGSIDNTVQRGAKHLRKWRLNLPPSKAKEFIGHFGQHSLLKKTQADFIFGLAEGMGHYRDGSRIREILKGLKAQPHRLNEPSKVPALIATVRNISDEEIADRQVAGVKRKWRERKSALHAIVEQSHVSD